MLPVNENNNDELFRKAAEDYFLKAENPDWDNVLNKMTTHNEPSNDKTSHRKKKYYPLLFLFNGSRSILRLFGFNAWLDKSKKKIDPGKLYRRPAAVAGMQLIYAARH